MDKEVETLAKYRLEQAKENLEEAQILLERGKYKGANNRAYYAIFHAIKAVLALESIDFKKHSTVLAYFNKEYINKEIFPKELGRRVSKASFYREKSDYVDFYIVNKQETIEQIESARVTINLVEKYFERKNIR